MESLLKLLEVGHGGGFTPHQRACLVLEDPGGRHDNAGAELEVNQRQMKTLMCIRSNSRLCHFYLETLSKLLNFLHLNFFIYNMSA